MASDSLEGREIHEVPASSKKSKLNIIDRDELENSSSSSQVSETPASAGVNENTKEPKAPTPKPKPRPIIDTPDTTVLGMESLSGSLGFEEPNDNDGTDVLSDASAESDKNSDTSSDAKPQFMPETKTNDIVDKEAKLRSNDTVQDNATDDKVALKSKELASDKEDTENKNITTKNKDTTVDSKDSKSSTDRDSECSNTGGQNADSKLSSHSSSDNSYSETTVAEIGNSSSKEVVAVSNEDDSGYKFFLERVSNGERVPINKDNFVVGKSKHSDYQVKGNNTISRSHIVITINKEKNALSLTDKNSKNGTSVDGIYLKNDDTVELKNGSKIRLSDEEFKLLIIES